MRATAAVPRGGLVAVHAHPDDETLTSGALLATWASSGEPVGLVTCTRGERGEVIGPDPSGLEGDGPALAAHRERELAAALDALGVTDHAFLDTLDLLDGPFPGGAGGTGSRGPAGGRRTASREPVRYEDSGMAWVAPGVAARDAVLPSGAFVGVDLDESAGRLAGLLLERRPRVVATYEPGGGYGHPDHVRAHEVTVRAVVLAHASAGEAFVEELWFAVLPESVARSTRRSLPARPGLELPAVDGALPSVVVPDDDLGDVVTVEVPRCWTTCSRPCVRTPPRSRTRDVSTA
ncbi:hypothetical protein GCM10025865_02470 [Paraoerskovia sediminicola]|uniref:N-acetyl-1-D-myo-inositol-2-amino-2-deoxy-alpha-D-glucopyranoside deacetylase n=1 Tax=Paraoerskovia sediminicola TaxID=1138587 RepID=A0ABM8FYW5_9CELL|nr:PIG-L family deacetylase [Paraoerskovia sediminicola]BDZ40948.1 hypothetical protein GCM10025865_02470 [Paraoerskovia sediminicola]